MTPMPGGRTAPAGGARAGGDAGWAAGQGFVEFGVILALAALVAVAVLVFFRPQLAWVLSLIGSEVDKAGHVLAGLTLL
jgi:Flp pilus assembly pilin Flp